MLLQKQLKSNDCWRTCIASILSLPADQVPHFYGIYPSAHTAITKARSWLNERNHNLITLYLPGELSYEQALSSSWCAPNMYAVLSGMALNNADHAVIVYNGIVVMDPSTGEAPQQTPFKNPLSTGFWVLEIVVGKVRGLHETFD